MVENINREYTIRGMSRTKKCIIGVFIFALACLLLGYFGSSYQPPWQSTYFATPGNGPLNADTDRRIWIKDGIGTDKIDRIPQDDTSTEMSKTSNKPKNSETADCEIDVPFTIKYSEIKQDDPCEATFCPTLEGNKRKIDSYNFTKAERYLNQFLPNQNLEIITKGPGTSNIEIPVFVGGASSNHFQEALGLFKKLNELVRPAYPTSKLFYYDLGLRASEISGIKSVCNCTVLEFPFNKFPEHVKHLFSY